MLHFLEVKYSSEKSRQIKTQLKTSIVKNLSQDRYVAPISGRLIELGIRDYRQYLIDEHNLVFYRIDAKEKQVILLALMDSRQSIRKLLHEVMLLS